MKPIRLTTTGLSEAEKTQLAAALRAQDFEAVFDPADRLIEEENQLRSIMAASFDAVVLVDRDGHVSGWSPAAEEMFGYRGPEMEGRPVFSLMSDRYAKEDHDYVLQALASAPLPFPGQRAEVECRRKDGAKFPAELRVAKWTAEGAMGFCLCLRDVSEKHQGEQQRVELEGQLLRAQKIEAIAALAAGIAHDFNNMLTVILGNADLAEALLEKDHPATEAIAEVHAAAGRAASLTRQLLLFSRKQPMQKKQVNLGEMLEELSRLLRRIIPEGIAFRYEKPAVLWSVQADVSLMEQAITNLVINAKEATGPGGAIIMKAENREFADRPAATVGDGRSGRAVCISVTDTGTGIEPGIQPSIFDPFVTTKAPGKGAGIGLAVVSRVVRDHGGWIHLVSRPGDGTTVEIFLPVPAQARNLAPTAAASAAAGTPGQPQRILLAEDEPGVGSFAERALRSHGYEVVHVSTIGEALTAFESKDEHFDLIFSDAVLPDGLGITLMDKVLERKPCPAVLLTSGYTGKTSQLDPVVARGIPFLPKPYTMPVLLKIVREVIAQGPPARG